ncbi:MAG: nucleotidyltransferase [Nitrospira sp.]|nr:nucleotidyltransferase [Nitrospira sp.]
MSQELEILQMVTTRLAEAGIPYMVTGSIAMNYYAIPRMTRDIDIVIELSEEDVEETVRLFQGDFYVDREMVQQAVKDRLMFNVIHNAYMIKVDLIVRKNSDYRKEEFSRRRTVKVDGHAFHIVAPEDLILSKLDWAKDSHSEIQLGDVRNLLAAVPQLDHDYMAGWAERLGLKELYQEVMA